MDDFANNVTILIPALGCAPYLNAAIGSAVHCRVARVVVVDNGSVDETPSVVAEWARKYPGLVASVRRSVTWELADSLNEAVNSVDTPFFARLDGDDLLVPEFLSMAYRRIALDPSVAVISGYPARIKADDHLAFAPSATPGIPDSADVQVMNGIDGYRFVVRWDPNASSSGSLFRCAAFKAVGGFDRDVPWGEDWEIWLRFLRQWSVAYCHAPAALYRMHAASATATGMRADRLCFGYDYVYRRALQLCPDARLRPELRRGFFKTAKTYFGSCKRGALRREPVTHILRRAQRGIQAATTAAYLCWPSA